MSATRIYVACLASYNNGSLHGKWIDANQDADTIHEEIQRMLYDSPFPNVQTDWCPDCLGTGESFPGVKCNRCKATGAAMSADEYAIHDYEGFAGLRLDEYASIATVADIAHCITEHGPAYAAYVDAEGVDYANEQRFLERFRGRYDSERDYAEELVEDTGMLSTVDDTLARYFDYDAFARDLFIDDVYKVSADGYGENGIYVFDR